MVRRIRSLLRNVIRRDRMQRDLDDELRAMFDLPVEEKMAARHRSIPPLRCAPSKGEFRGPTPIIPSSLYRDRTLVAALIGDPHRRRINDAARQSFRPFNRDHAVRGEVLIEPDVIEL